MRRDIARMNKNLLIEYLNCRRLPMSQEAIHLHSALCEEAPDFYLHLLADPAAEVSHKREVLTNLLWNPAAHEVARQHILATLYALPLNEALRVISVIRDERINRSRARELLLGFLIGHEQFPALAATKRQRIVRLLKHALGEQTWSSVKRFLAGTTLEGEAFLQRMVLRYAWNSDTMRAREVLSFLAGVACTPRDPLLTKSLAARQNIEQGEGLPKETLLGLRGIYHKQVPVKKIAYLSAVTPQTVHQDGPLTEYYKAEFSRQAHQSTEAPEQEESLLTRLSRVFAASEQEATEAHVSTDEYKVAALLEQALESVPQVEGRLGIALDLSSSMISSGERLHHPVALALALVRLLRARVRESVFAQIGGSISLDEETLPTPQGVTDIATSIVRVARDQPQALFVITDGYENTRPGDAEQVVQGLRNLGLTMPVCQVVPLFAAFENLSQRKLGANIPVIPVAHEEGVRELLARVMLASANETLSANEVAQLQQLLFAK